MQAPLMSIVQRRTGGSEEFRLVCSEHGCPKELMNKVTEARKAAEANLIMRREETAAIRSQANTAKLLADKVVNLL